MVRFYNSRAGEICADARNFHGIHAHPFVLELWERRHTHTGTWFEMVVVCVFVGWYIRLVPTSCLKSVIALAHMMYIENGVRVVGHMTPQKFPVCVYKQDIISARGKFFIYVCVNFLHPRVLNTFSIMYSMQSPLLSCTQKLWWAAGANDAAAIISSNSRLYNHHHLAIFIYLLTNHGVA